METQNDVVAETLAEMGAPDSTFPVPDCQNRVAGSSLETDVEDAEWDLDVHLIPPPSPTYRIKARLRVIGVQPARVFFDPERD
ncbi:MAG: hypothetical protein M3Y56_10155 [Armatimonadota bacterium]|nr:hypothetical protein [Armatimonadota bacterium]